MTQKEITEIQHVVNNMLGEVQCIMSLLDRKTGRQYPEIPRVKEICANVGEYLSELFHKAEK